RKAERRIGQSRGHCIPPTAENCPAAGSLNRLSLPRRLLIEDCFLSRERDMPHGSDLWSDWLEEHGTALLLFARQWVSNHADAEDVVQEAFVRFWRSRGHVAEPARYLFAAVKHCALDRQRARARQSRREESIAVPECEPSFDIAESDERGAVVAAALQELPESQREVLVLKIWGGLSFPQ